MAVSLVTAENAAHFALIERRHGLQVVRETIAGFEPEMVLPAVSRDQAAGGIKGRRPSKKTSCARPGCCHHSPDSLLNT